MNSFRSPILTSLSCFLLCANFGCKPHATTSAEALSIETNLSRIYFSGMQCMLDKGTPEARYADIVSAKYEKAPTPVNGEDYTALVVTLKATSLSVKTADGREITWQAHK